MNLQLENQIAMVAASSRGLGFGVTRALALEGASVSLAGRDRAALERAAGELRSETGRPVLATVADVSSAQALGAWHEATMRAFGGVDLLVANGGGPPAGPFEGFDDAAWQSAFENNLLSVVRMIRLVLPAMRQRGGGAILTVTSITVKEPAEPLVLSNVMRSGVTSLVKSLSVQLAPDRIRVNNLMPGRIDTDRVRSLDGIAAGRTGQSPDAVKAAAEKSIPLGRYGTIDEFGRAAAFLLSGAASYITGSSLAVDGGSLKTVW